jgi:hypothetical protein
MAAPSRHITISGLPAMLLCHYFPVWPVYIVAGLFSFISHIGVDVLFDEYWNRTPSQTFILAATGTIAMFAAYWFFAVPMFGWATFLIMAILACGMDIIDGVVQAAAQLKNTIFQPLFPCHFGNKHYIPQLFPTESFTTTVLLEVVAAIILILVVVLL